MVTAELVLWMGGTTAAMVAFGLWQALKRKRAARAEWSEGDDFFLAGQDLGPVEAGFSGATTAESGWVLLGLTGIAYQSGIGALWLIPGCASGHLFLWWVLGPHLRRAVARGERSYPQILASRAGPDWENRVRLVAAGIIVLFMVTYAAAQFGAVGKALNAILDVDFRIGVLVGLGVVMIYLIPAGFRGAVWTDLPQAALVIVTLLTIPVVGWVLFDGSLTSALSSENAPLFDLMGGATGTALLGFVLGWSGIGLGYMGQVHVATRPMAARDDQTIRSGGFIASLWATLVFLGAIASGLVIRAWLPGLMDPEQALPRFLTLFAAPPLAGIALAAVFAAIISTVDSQILVAVQTANHDLRKARSGRTWNPRVLLVVFGIAAATLAATENRVVFTFVLFAWSILGASVGTAMIGALLWPRTSGAGIFAGMVGGGLTAIVWRLIPALSGALYELVPAFLVGLLLTRYVGRTTFRQESTVCTE